MTETTTTKDTAVNRALGRRKEAAARVRLISASQEFVVNNKPLATYFSNKIDQALIVEPLKLVGLFETFGVTVKVAGGGVRGQAVAVRHGIARALVRLNPDYRKTLKAIGFLRRDPRSKERKKFGLKRARKSAQWSKR